jgi:opacity protein-like surface antigen
MKRRAGSLLLLALTGAASAASAAPQDEPAPAPAPAPEPPPSSGRIGDDTQPAPASGGRIGDEAQPAAPEGAETGEPTAPKPRGTGRVEVPDDGTRAIRRRNLSTARIFRGPFSTSRLFSMPTADVIGAYMLTLSGDASLLQATGLFTSAGVVAVGFGDIAQLEYRHTAAISVTGVNAPLPAAGVQIKIPIPEYKNVPAFGIAFRLGVPRTERLAETVIEETVTDLYLVGRLRFEFAPWLTLHGGARISSAKIQLSGDRAGTENTKAEQRLTLPTAGYEIRMNKEAKIVGEIALAPRFTFMPGPDTKPEIGYGVLGRLGLRWAVIPSVIIDGSINYQNDVGQIANAARFDEIVQWDIRLGAEVFVPWGALACRAAGVFCD